MGRSKPWIYRPAIIHSRRTASRCKTVGNARGSLRRAGLGEMNYYVNACTVVVQSCCCCCCCCRTPGGPLAAIKSLQISKVPPSERPSKSRRTKYVVDMEIMARAAPSLPPYTSFDLRSCAGGRSYSLVCIPVPPPVLCAIIIKKKKSTKILLPFSKRRTKDPDET